MYHRHVFTHNQATSSHQRILSRKDAVWFSLGGQTYMALPANRGIVQPGQRDITYLVAKTPAKNTSSPRLFGKRETYRMNAITIFH